MEVDWTTLKPSISAWAQQYPEIHAVLLFGSRATGKNRPDSDFDVCLMVDGAYGEDWYTRWHFNADKWKLEFSNVIGVPPNLIQFCTFTSVQVKNGVESAFKFLFLREELPQQLPEKF